MLVQSAAMPKANAGVQPDIQCIAQLFGIQWAIAQPEGERFSVRSSGGGAAAKTRTAEYVCVLLSTAGAAFDLDNLWPNWRWQQVQVAAWVSPAPAVRRLSWC
jgi:hypothetical protein